MLRKIYDRALEECFKLLELFGLSEQLSIFLPSVLMDGYLSYLQKQQISTKQFDYSEEDLYLEEIWCSANLLLTKWRRKYFSPIDIERLFIPAKKVIAFNWEGNIVFSWERKELAYLTNKLAVLQNKYGQYEVYHADSGDPLPKELTEIQFNALFSPAEKYKSFINSFHFISPRISRKKWLHPDGSDVEYFNIFNLMITSAGYQSLPEQYEGYFGEEALAQLSTGGTLKIKQLNR